MILTDREIITAIRCDQLRITPAPDPTAFSSTSVDLTLGKKGTVWKEKGGVMLRPANPKYTYKSLIEDFQTSVEIANFVLEPKGLLLAWTAEEIELPITSRLAARVEGKSSVARLGIGIHLTAPTIHAGFRGPIQLEIFNFGPHQVVLDPGLKICQLIFEQTFGTPEKGYSGAFFDQKSG